MVTLTLAGRSFEIAPYKLGALRQAAPHIDAINASAASIDSVEGLIANAEHMIAIVAIGLRKIDPALTAEALDDIIGAGDLAALGTAMRDILSESGLAPKDAEQGEPAAPSEPAAEGASPISSETLSAN